MKSLGLLTERRGAGVGSSFGFSSPGSPPLRADAAFSLARMALYPLLIESSPLLTAAAISGSELTFAGPLDLPSGCPDFFGRALGGAGNTLSISAKWRKWRVALEAGHLSVYYAQDRNNLRIAQVPSVSLCMYGVAACFLNTRKVMKVCNYTSAFRFLWLLGPA